MPGGGAGSRAGAPSPACAATEAAQSPRPSAPPLLLGRIPSRGAELVRGTQKGKETVVKHAILKIPLKSMGTWPLAMSRAAAGPSRGLELQLTSYIFFSPSFS